MFHSFNQIEDCTGWHRDVLSTRRGFADFPPRCSSLGRGVRVVPLPAHNGRLQVPYAKLSRGRQCLHLWLVLPYHREPNLEQSDGNQQDSPVAHTLPVHLQECYIR